MMLFRIKKLINNPLSHLVVILILSLIFRVTNINYNSIFSDESVYIAIGHSIFFNWNWTIYNTASWVGGFSFFYPVVSAIAYNFYGLIGTRLLSVFFSMLTLWFVYLITQELIKFFYDTKDKKKSIYAGLLSLSISSFSAVSLAVSRLATYDAPSFLFYVLSVYFLTKLLNIKGKFVSSRYMFISSLFFVVSFSFKYITVIYAPVLVVVGGIIAARNKLLKQYSYYFMLPLFLGISAIFIGQYQYLKTYFLGQSIREASAINEIASSFLFNTKYVLPFFIFSAPLLLTNTKRKIFLTEIIFILPIIAFHFVFSRISGIDKHSLLIVYPVSIFFALSTYKLLEQRTFNYLICLFITAYVYLCFNQLNYYNNIWTNYTKGINYLDYNGDEGDKLLAESGSFSILSVSKGLDVTTFDWFVYQGETYKNAYLEAVEDAYFNYIEVDTNKNSITNSYKIIDNLISNSLEQNYHVVYNDEHYLIYERDF